MQTIARHLPCRGEHAHDQWQIQPRAFLPNVGRREVHDDAPKRPLELGALDSGPDALPGVLHSRPGQSGHDQRREATADVSFHRDEVPADAEHRHPQDPPVHERRTIATTTDTGRLGESSR